MLAEKNLHAGKRISTYQNVKENVKRPNY